MNPTTINGEVITGRDTAPETAVRTAESPGTPGPGGEARPRVNARARLAALGAVFKRLWAIAVGDDTTIWSATPNSPAQLVRYARDGQWCAPTSRAWRLLGRLDTALISIPLTVALYTAAWVVQRPGRRLATAFLIFILWLVIP
ncbi:MAG TPA: hypothetical protein VJT31_35750 [Rugosimonospora sp.]|nr:hypothetical protein [Rugosimonospora sp.]